MWSSFDGALQAHGAVGLSPSSESLAQIEEGFFVVDRQTACISRRPLRMISCTHRYRCPWTSVFPAMYMFYVPIIPRVL